MGVGKDSPATSYGTAAYKTNELDTFLDDKPVQYREVDGHESDLFKSYFETITVRQGDGDAGSGMDDETDTVMYEIDCDGAPCSVEKVPLSLDSLDEDMAYVITNPDTDVFYQINGATASTVEKLQASTLIFELNFAAHKAIARVVVNGVDAARANEGISAELDA